MDDVRAVMDAVGSDQAALFGYSEGGAMSILFAATIRPARARSFFTRPTQNGAIPTTTTRGLEGGRIAFASRLSLSRRGGRTSTSPR